MIILNLDIFRLFTENLQFGMVAIHKAACLYVFSDIFDMMRIRTDSPTPAL